MSTPRHAGFSAPRRAGYGVRGADISPQPDTIQPNDRVTVLAVVVRSGVFEEGGYRRYCSRTDTRCTGRIVPAPSLCYSKLSVAIR